MADVKNIWLNFVSEKMVREQNGPKGPFYNVSFDCKKSASGIATVSVNKGQVRPSTKKDGSEAAGYVNVLLGAPGSQRQVSVKKEDGSFDRISMTVDEIAESFNAGRSEYRAEQAAKEAPAIEPETEAPAETVDGAKTKKGRKTSRK